MASVFIKVDVRYRLPNKSGIYITNRGVIQFTSAYDRWYGLEPQWWLEEIELPTEEEIKNEEKSVYEVNDDKALPYKSLWRKGANFILYKLKGGNNG